MDNLKTLLDQIKSENYLKGLRDKDFVERSAYFLAEINMVHPFREGNGRVLREYYRCLALKSGYIIDWALVDSKELLISFIYSVGNDTSKLVNCIYKAIDGKIK